MDLAGYGVQHILRENAREIDRLRRCGCGSCIGRARMLYAWANPEVKAMIRSDYPATHALLTGMT